MKTKTLTIAAITLVLTASLTACQVPAEQDDIIWTQVDDSALTTIDGSTGAFVEGHLATIGGGDTKSRNVIDYAYAYELDDGGIRQKTVSATYNAVSLEGYPGAEVVTIYQDAQADGSDARIEAYECSITADRNLEYHLWEQWYCLMPNGEKMSGNVRIDIHVPPGSLVQSLDDTGQK